MLQIFCQDRDSSNFGCTFYLTNREIAFLRMDGNKETENLQPLLNNPRTYFSCRSGGLATKNRRYRSILLLLSPVSPALCGLKPIGRLPSRTRRERQQRLDWAHAGDGSGMGKVQGPVARAMQSDLWMPTPTPRARVAAMPNFFKNNPCTVVQRLDHYAHFTP